MLLVPLYDEIVVVVVIFVVVAAVVILLETIHDFHATNFELLVLPNIKEVEVVVVVVVVNARAPLWWCACGARDTMG